MNVAIIGAGLAGCEAALWLASQGVQVSLYEQKPEKNSPAHSMQGFAELVCSNSLKSKRVDSAGGLLKAEMMRMGSFLLPAAEKCSVPAGGALAVDRAEFSRSITALVQASPNIKIVYGEVESLGNINIPLIVASGPLTEGKLAEEIDLLTGGGRLSFFDAASPIVSYDSLDLGKVFAASRYGKGEADYINCPFNKENYGLFHTELIQAETVPLKDFEGEMRVYEGCMPVEVMAKRGVDTLRYGPLRPVGLTDPSTGRRPWANVQLRKENTEGSLYNIVGFQTNLKFGEQKRVFSMIPGLENAEFARYGVMHRNTFLNSPSLLLPTQALKNKPNVYFAGQITGVEGYTESMLSGQLAARAVLADMQGKSYELPPGDTMSGVLVRYILAENSNFQPMGANMGLVPPLAEHVKDKRLRYEALSKRALESLEKWVFL